MTAPSRRSAPPLPAASPAGDVTRLDRTLTPDDARVHDALCVLQAPSGVQRLSDLMAAAQLRTGRGTAFTPAEVRLHAERLVAGQHAARDPQGRLRASAPHALARFAELMRDPAAAANWFEAWRRLVNFDRAFSLGFQEEEQLAAAIRLVLFGSGRRADFERLIQLAFAGTHLWRDALNRAVLEPFDAALFDRLAPDLQALLAEQLLMVLGGFVETRVRPLEAWLRRRFERDPASVAPGLRYRLAETAFFAGDSGAAERFLAGLNGASIGVLRAGFEIAAGRWEAGVAGFEAGLKQIGAVEGRRKNLLSPSLGWVYLMGLLALGTPSAWSKARKFAAAEGGKTDPFGFWAVWQEAIDQRLGDSPKAPDRFVLARRERSGLQSTHYLHHLLLAAWLRVDMKAPAEARGHAQQLAADFDAAGMHWLALLARRAAAALRGESPALDDAAQAFFIGAPQDSWREALASILALGGDAVATPRAGAAGVQDRLIWVVSAGPDGRLLNLGAVEQKAGVRGLGKAKPVTLATLVRRTDLPAHDAALLRAVVREDYGNRPVFDLAAAAPALVRHPFVAWERDPAQFIEVVEALPALEIMTQGEHIGFRLLDPVRTAQHKSDEEDDDDLPQRWRAGRLRLRNVMLLADGPGRARLVRLTPAQLRVAELVSQGWKVPVAARAELDAALRVLAAHFQVASDAEAGHEVEASALLRAELTPQGSGLAVALRAAPFGDFGPRLAPGSGRERVTTVHQGVTLSTRRDLARERAAVTALLEAVELLDDSGHDWLLDEPEQALAVVEGLSRLGESIVSEWPKGQPIRVRAVPDAAVTLKGSSNSKGDWLDLDGELTLDGGEVMRLRQLLELAQASRGRYMALGAGDFLALSDALRQQLADLAALAQQHGSGQRLSGVAALAWQASGHSLELTGDAAWRKRSQAWADAQERVFEPPAGLDADLRDYQLEGYRWLMRLAASGFGAVLADDMGLGKTVQTLAMLLQRGSGGAALVVAPTSVCGNWLVEAARFAPGLRVELYGDVLEGDDLAENATDPSAAEGDAPAAQADNARRVARRRQVRGLGPGSLLVCSYALLQIDADILAGVDWHSVVLDEAQQIKNPVTRRAKAALALRADFRLALTGTPIENRLGELWSIMAFCNPGLLGSADRFARNFGNPIEREGDPYLKSQASRRLRRLLAPFLLRRTKSQVLTDLPPRTEIVHEVVPGPRERALHEALRQQAEDSVAQAAAQAGSGGAGQARFQMLAALTRLRRAACDPRLVAPELGIVGAKVQEFERLAVELVAGRHKALVFSQFTDFLALLRERLDAAGIAYQYLDGSTPAAERTKRVAAFQAGAGDLFLISLKAGGFGLNLTVADYVIIADPWWNPATEEQASARAHRIGQQRPVTVYRLVTQGSIEEKIVRLHRSKRDLAEGILAGQETGAPVDAAQLLDLLRST